MDKIGSCRFREFDDGLISLMFQDFEPTREFLEDLGYMAGGYTWHGIVEAFVRTKKPQYANLLNYDPESSMFVAISESRDALIDIAKFIQRCQTDKACLEEHVELADDSIIE